MRELLEFIVNSLVDNPEAVKIEEFEEEDQIKFVITASEEEIGKIIGKQGKIAKSIRTIVRSKGYKDGKKVLIEIN